MIISISGCDGAGKSTQGELLAKKIANEKDLKWTSIFEVMESDTYDSSESLNDIYEKLCKYDVIVSRFYLKGERLKALQDKLVMSSNDIFNNKDAITEVAECAQQEARIWNEKVISKLLDLNKIIIFDRYFFDEIAYRGLYSIPMQTVEELYREFAIPDKAFFLHIEIDEILKRNSVRKDIKTTLFQNRDKLVQLLDNFGKVSKKYNLSIIYGDKQSKTQVCEHLYEEVRPLI